MRILETLAAVCVLASVLVAPASAQSGPASADEEGYTDADPAERAGFRILDFVMKDDGPEVAIIRREFLPGLYAKLPDKQTGFSFAMADLDGDGGPELFLRIHHWTICEKGCPVHVYRFENGAWKQIFEASAALFGIRPPRTPKERPAVAVMYQEDDGRGPTISTFYRWERNGKFVRYAGGKNKGAGGGRP